MNQLVLYILTLQSLQNYVLTDLYVNEAPTAVRATKIEDVYLRFYNGSTDSSYVTWPLDKSLYIFTFDGFNSSKPTTIYVHGSQCSLERECLTAVASAYVEAASHHNFLAIDWSNMAGADYINLVCAAVASQLNTLNELSLSLDSLHLIGHSDGAHLSGCIARELKITYQKPIPRVTGLDPSHAVFYPEGIIFQHIKATDAGFVDIIHTAPGALGTPESTGTADFWPNKNDSSQPGCQPVFPFIGDQCSHERAILYYAESVRNPYAFLAKSNDTFEMLLGQTTAPMGYACQNARGNYFLTTNSEPPYGKGDEGKDVIII